jgi:RHS repeat-associated protein
MQTCTIPRRHFSSSCFTGAYDRRYCVVYRYGFNGKEDDPETGYQDYGMRQYDPRLARFFAVDPLAYKYPWYTPYQFAGNCPIEAIDLDGAEPQSTKEDAKKRIEEFKNSNPSQSDVFKNVSPEQLIEDLTERIDYPDNLTQGDGTNLCGPAALTSGTLLDKDPLGYVNLVISLYQKGSASYNNYTSIKTLTLDAGVSEIVGTKAMETYGAKAGVTGYSLADNVADQILLLSMKSTYGTVPAYGRVTIDDLGNSPGWASTTFGEFVNMAEDFYGYNVLSNGQTGGAPSFNSIDSDINKYNGFGTLYIFYKPSVATGESLTSPIGTHYIRVHSATVVGENVILDMWDYGSRRPVTYNLENFKRSVFGYALIINP